MARTPLRKHPIALYSASLAVGNLLLGTLILLGGAIRMSGPSFIHVISVAPYWFWGSLFIAAGLSTLCGQFAAMPGGQRRSTRIWMIRYGHSIGGVVCFYFVVAFCVGAYQILSTSLTGIAAYATLGTLHAVAAGFTPGRADH
jgi:hypothetical protein